MHELSRTTVVRFCLGVAALCALVYGWSLRNDFVYWDDPILVIENPISHGFSGENIVEAFTSYDPELYIPLTFLSYQLDYELAGLAPALYHLTNLLLHIGASILAGWVTFLLFRRPWVAAAVAVLFAVHPLHVETVAWISARKDVLASFFALLSLGLYLRWREGASRKWYVAALVAFLLGLLSKVSILTLPLLFFLVDWKDRKRFAGMTLAVTIPFYVLSSVFGVVALFGKTQSGTHLVGKALVAARATLWTLLHHFLPVGYSVLYPYDRAIGLGNADLLLSLLAVVALTAGAWMIRFRRREVSFGWFWFLILLAPSFLTIEKGGDLARDVYVTSDRYAYLASIGVFIAVAALLDRARNRKILNAGFGAAVAVLATLSFFQSLTWRNTETLFRHVLRWHPDSHVAWNNIGAYYDELGDPEKAAEAYVRSVELKESGHGWFNLGQIAMRQNRPADAIAAFTRAVELRPFHPVAQLNLGALLLDTGKPEEALPHLLEAQKLDPTNVAAYLNLGIALERLGNLHDARRAYERALQVEPGNEYAARKLQELP